LSDIGALVEELIAAGTPPAVAASVVARAVLAGKDAAPYRDDLPDVRSKAAIRQQRYRERNASVTKRNENVTQRNAENVTPNVTERNETITERNENVTPLRPDNSRIYLSSSSSNSEEKKERKKERIPRKRNAPLSDDWSPSLKAYQLAEQCGQNVQIVEQIFRDYLKSSGRLYADYDAAFNNFIRNQQRFNGSTKNAKTGGFDDAYERVLEKLNAGFAGSAPEERDGPAAGEDHAGLLAYGKRQ
jgi:hypothetical protein